jgi:hypothetical protein
MQGCCSRPAVCPTGRLLLAALAVLALCSHYLTRGAPQQHPGALVHRAPPPAATSALRALLAASEPPSTAQLLRTLALRGDASTAAPCSAASLLPAVASWRVAWPHGAATASAPCYAAGAVHVVVLTALDAGGAPLCRGGDLLEAWLQGAAFRARARARDFQNGTYAILVSLPQDEAAWGAVNLTVAVEWLSYSGLATAGGVRRTYAHPVPPTLLRVAPRAECAAAAAAATAAASLGEPLEPPPPAAASCRALDFTSPGVGEWEGHWLRLDPGAAACPRGLCTGHPQRLGSPWVYRLGGATAGSPSCHMHIFSPSEARACLNTSWLYMSGDSTFRDSGWSLMTAVLGANMSGWGEQQPYSHTFDFPAYRAPPVLPWVPPHLHLPLATTPLLHWPGHAHSSAWRVRVSNSFNGHPNPWEDFLGLGGSARDGAWRAAQEDLLVMAAQGAVGEPARAPAPSAFLVTSGPSDAVGLRGAPLGGVKDFSESLALALQWWERMESLAAAPCSGSGSAARRHRRRPPPRRLWRTNPAPSAEVQHWEINTQRMEVYGRVVREALKGGGGGGAPGGVPAGSSSSSGGGGGGSTSEALRAACDAAAPPPRRAGEGAGGGGAGEETEETGAWEIIDYYDLTFGCFGAPRLWNPLWPRGWVCGRHGASGGAECAVPPVVCV